MAMKIIFALFGLILFVSTNAQRDGYCLANDYEPYLQFSSKTAYEFVKGNENSHNFVADCDPIMFWSLNRHGTRLPGVKTMSVLSTLTKTRDDIIGNYEIRKTAPDRGRLCDADIEHLKNWIWNRNFTANYANDLSFQGYDDMKYLAKRWQSRFPNILPSQYSSNHYLFKYTEERRTKDSFKAFADGLFGREGANSVRPSPTEVNDTLLMLTGSCNTWLSEVKNNPVLSEQINNIKNKEEYKNLIQNVSSHLGYRYPLEESVIKNMYDMCRFDKAWEINKNSPWCAAFTKDQLMLLEYIEDLKFYYQNGYGNQINKQIGASPLKDMMDRFTSMIEHPEKNQPKAVAYFSHTTTILSFLTALGAAEDSVPLLADNYHTPNIQRRKWKTSLINPFAANVAAILHKCRNNGEHKVLFFLNERPVEFNDCQVGLCSWDTMKNKYGKLVNDWNTKFCFKNTANLHSKYNLYIMVGSLVTIVFSRIISTKA